MGFWARFVGAEKKVSRRAPSAPGWVDKDYRDAASQWDPNAPATQLPVYGVPPAKAMPVVQAALTALEQGQFFAPAILWDGMLRDDRIAAKSEERVDRLIGSPFESLPAKDTVLAKKVAADFLRQHDRIMPSPQLGKLIRNGMAMSVGIAQVKSSMVNGQRVPTIETWSNRYLRWDWLLRKYRMVTENRGEITIDPDDPEWIIYEPYGPLGFLDGAKIRSNALPYLIRYWVRLWWPREREVHGQPIRAGIIPPTRDPADERVFLSQISNLAAEAVLRLPQGEDGNKFDMKLIEAAGNSWQGFLKLIEHCDDSIAISWLGQSQSTRGQGGLGSQENAGESTILRLVRKDRVGVVEMTREQLIKPWGADNWGTDELAPIPNWQIEPPEDEEKASKVDQSVAAACVDFKSSGAPIKMREYLTERGYPVMTSEEEVAAKKQAMEEAQQMAKTLAPKDDEEEGNE